MIRWVAVGVVCLWAGAAEAQPKSEFDIWTDKLITKPTATVCTTSYSLKDADKAFLDEKWMKEIGCVWLRAKLPVTLLEPSSLFGVNQYGRGRPWRVRLTMPSGEGITVYANPYQLMMLDGKEIPARFL